MKYSEFENWMIENCPDSLDIDVFLEMLACNTAMLIQIASKKSGVSECQLVHDFVESFENPQVFNS